MSIKNMFPLLEKIAAEKGVSKEKIVEILKISIEKAYLKENPDVIFEAVLDPEKETIELYEKKIVVDKSEDEIDDDKEINLEDALKINSNYKLGDEVHNKINISDFERRVAGHVAQVLSQNIHEISSKKVYEEWKDKVGYIIRAEVEKNDDRLAWVSLGDTKGVVLKADQIPGEELVAGKSYLFLVKKVDQQSKGWQIILSRTDEKLLKFILTNEVSEIKSGMIQIRKMARIVGYKTKVALSATQPGIDAIGITVGPKGERIKSISQQLNNERIDVILYDEDPRQFLVNACHPEKIVGLEISDDEDRPESKIVTIVCEESSLSKLIGKNGINIKLLNRLTGWQIDIISKDIALEDDVKFEDVTSFTSSKVKQTKFTSASSYSNETRNAKGFRGQSNRQSFRNNNNNNKDFMFKNTFDDDTTFDNLYEGIQGITDEDVENLINFDIDNNPKKKRKQREDDEEVVLVAGNYEPDFLSDDVETLDETNDTKEEKEEVVVETKEEAKKEEPVKTTTIDLESFGFKENKKPKKENKKPKKEPKQKKEKISWDDLLNEDVDYEEEISNVDDLDVDDLDNLELDEE